MSSEPSVRHQHGGTNITTPTPTPPQRRKNYSPEDDLILLRQVLADLPFEAQRGGVLDAWDAVVGCILSEPGFGIRTASGKTAQARFNDLIERHRDSDKAAARAFGIEEDYTEREQLLDELTSRLDEHARAERERSEQEKARAERLESAGYVVRERVLVRMRD